MKLRKIFCAAVLVIAVFTTSALAAPQDALSLKSNDSVYVAMGLSDAGNFARWLLSQENIDAFMPLILASESSNEIIGYLEVIRSITAHMPLESVALVAGVNKGDIDEPFMQMAFTVAPELNSIVSKIKDGSAQDSDFAKLFLGTNSPMLTFAETMIKTERGEDGVYTIDNVIKFKAEGDLLVLALSDSDLKSALNALDVEGARLFHNVGRKFDTEDFIFTHLDFDTIKTFDDDKDLQKIASMFKAPLNAELGFQRVPDRFTASFTFNLREALIKAVADKLNNMTLTPVKGSYINLDTAGGSSSPIIALGGIFNAARLYDNDDAKKAIQNLAKLIQSVLGITEEELLSLINGPFFIIVNDSINLDSFKIPALYMSFTGQEGAAAKIFEKLSASKFFSRIQEKILQLDSSISPVSFLVVNNEGSINFNFADLTSLNDKPQPSEKFAELISKTGISALWIDFEGIQKWIADNNVIAILSPMAKMFGYGKIAEDAATILSAKFSVPSFAIWGESDEIVHFIFNIADVAPEDGILVRIVKICKDYMPKTAPAPATEPDTGTPAK